MSRWVGPARALTVSLVLTATLAASRPAAADGFLGRSVSHWSQALRDARPDVRRGAAFALGRCDSVAVLPPLVEALHDKDPGVRDAAAFALGTLAGQATADVTLIWKEAGPDLLKLLTADPDPFVRRSAACAAGQCGPAAAEAAGPLVRLLADPSPAVRQNAAWALGQLKEDAGDEAVRGLAGLVSDPDGSVRRDAAGALGAVGLPRAAAALPALAARLAGEPDPVARAAAADSLVKLASPAGRDAGPEIARLLTHADPAVVTSAALALGKMGGEPARKAVPALARLLQDPDPAVRGMAAAALVGAGEAAAAAVADLARALADRDPEVRRNAALALGRLGPRAEPALPALEKLLDRAQPPDVRLHAAETLSVIGPTVETILPTILAVLDKDDEPRVRQRMIWVLRQLRSPQRLRQASPILARLLDEKAPPMLLVRYDAARHLAFFFKGEAPPRTIDTLVEMLGASGLVVYEGSDATLTTGSEGAGGRTGIKERQSGDARYLAAEALAEMGPAANRPAVIAALEEAAKSPNPRTRDAARQALARIRPAAPSP